jgi:type III pantothenate kinase
VPEFAAVVDGAGGVRCGYMDAGQLGVDRWLITVAAWQRCRRPLVVVSAGTALTVDMVDGGGRHLGGYILPGLRLMASSLGVSTWGVRVESRDKASLAPGRSTVEAVSHGALTGAIGVIRQALAVSGARVLYLTGGDASVLVPWLEADTETWQAPDMVMEGLEIVLPPGEQPL